MTQIPVESPNSDRLADMITEAKAGDHHSARELLVTLCEQIMQYGESRHPLRQDLLEYFAEGFQKHLDEGIKLERALNLIARPGQPRNDESLDRLRLAAFVEMKIRAGSTLPSAILDVAIAADTDESTVRRAIRPDEFRLVTNEELQVLAEPISPAERQ